MPRPSKSRRLAVWMNGEKVGTWSINAQGQHEFVYEQEWINAVDARPLSLSMPLQPANTPYRGALVESYFDNLLPNSTDIRRRVQSRFGAASMSAFDLLVEIGRDCVGAVQLLPAGQPAASIKQITGEPLDENGVAATLRSAVSSIRFGQREEESLRISIAGAQEKTALLWNEDQWHLPSGATPTTHIFKLPLGRVGNMQADLSTSVENEWLCAQIVREFGLPATHCEIGDFAEQRVLIIERFDRRLASDGKWWLRLPQEDMCQATGTPPDLRYESDGGPGIADICSLLLGSRQAAKDRRDFFRAQVIYWLLCAPDGHAKNFSVFIEPQGRFSLTPLYDVLSAYPFLGKAANQLAPQKATMAMAALGKNRHYKWADIQPRHWLATAAVIGLEASARDDIQQIVERTPAIVDAVTAILPEGFPTRVADPILDGLLNSARKLAESG
jgi:serine/threonine-protein kinase HipA